MNSEYLRDLGDARGYAAANYADNVSGEPLDTLTPDRVRPEGLTAEDEMWFDDGFYRGIEAYENNQIEESE